MANADIFRKGSPCTPPIVEGITMALDAGTGLWKGTGLDTMVTSMTGTGAPFYTATEVSRFKGDFDLIGAKVTALASAQTTADAAALALSTDLANGTKITTLATASGAVATANDALLAAQTAARTPYLGKTNPFI